MKVKNDSLKQYSGRIGLSIDETCRLLSIDRYTLRRLVKQGILEARSAGPGRWIRLESIRKADLSMQLELELEYED